MDNLVLFWTEVAEVRTFSHVLNTRCLHLSLQRTFLEQKFISLYSDPWSNFCKTVSSSCKIAPAHRWVLQSSSTWLWRLMFYFFFPVEGFVRDIWKLNVIYDIKYQYVTMDRREGVLITAFFLDWIIGWACHRWNVLIADNLTLKSCCLTRNLKRWISFEIYRKKFLTLRKEVCNFILSQAQDKTIKFKISLLETRSTLDLYS